MNHLYLVQLLLDHLTKIGNQLRAMDERSKPGYLLTIFPHVPPERFPQYGTKAYWLLVLLSDGLPHDIWTIWIWLASTAGARSALQTLTNERGNYYWLIHNIAASGPAIYQLDSLHLSDSGLDDTMARLDAELLYLERSESLNQGAIKRLPEVQEKKRRLLSQNPGRWSDKPARPLPEL